ncbi:MAG: hypothetical protein HOY79_20855 [Streptomyces sp.]|nr:hypothetical protein [Streptomyces sp.]
MTKTIDFPGQQALIERSELPGSKPQSTESALTRNEWELLVEPDFLAFAAERNKAADPAFTSFDAFKAKALPDPANANWHGLFLARMHREGWLKYAGFDTSHRASSGGSALRRWAATEKTLTSYGEGSVS